MREHDLSHVRLEDPGDRQRVTGRLKHDAIVAGEALREQLKARPASRRSCEGEPHARFDAGREETSACRLPDPLTV